MQPFELADEDLDAVVGGRLEGGSAEGHGLGRPSKPGGRVVGVERERGAADLLGLLPRDRGETAEGLALLEVGLGRFCDATELLVAGGEGTQVYAVGLADAPPARRAGRIGGAMGCRRRR